MNPEQEEQLAELTDEAYEAQAEDDLQSVAEGEPVWSGHSNKLVVPNYDPVQTLLDKLDRWLLMQPEWAILLGAPRQTRRRAIQLMSKHILTIPTRKVQ